MDVEMSMTDVGRDGRYYFESMDRAENSVSHESCSKHACHARNVEIMT